MIHRRRRALGPDTRLRGSERPSRGPKQDGCRIRSSLRIVNPTAAAGNECVRRGIISILVLVREDFPWTAKVYLGAAWEGRVIRNRRCAKLTRFTVQRGYMFRHGNSWLTTTNVMGPLQLTRAEAPLHKPR
jgi:hypothetical protein